MEVGEGAAVHESILLVTRQSGSLVRCIAQPTICKSIDQSISRYAIVITPQGNCVHDEGDTNKVPFLGLALLASLPVSTRRRHVRCVVYVVFIKHGMWYVVMISQVASK
jgi:hypothetical protein